MIELKSVNKIYETEAEKVHALKSVNLTIDKAPTRPKDRAKEDLTIAIRDAVLTVTSNIALPNPLFELIESLYL